MNLKLGSFSPDLDLTLPLTSVKLKKECCHEVLRLKWRIIYGTHGTHSTFHTVALCDINLNLACRYLVPTYRAYSYLYRLRRLSTTDNPISIQVLARMLSASLILLICKYLTYRYE